jgi:hypothetical protein
LLLTAGSPEEAAARFAAAYERPKGTDYSARQALARSILEGKAVDGSGGPGARSWEIANRQSQLDDSATREFKQIRQDWHDGKGAPSRQALMDVIEAGRTTGNIDLLTKAQELGQQIDVAEHISQLPIDEQGQATAVLRARMASENPFAGADAVARMLNERTGAEIKGFEDNPVATSVGLSPDKFNVPPPLDFSDPQKLASGLQMRVNITQIGADKAKVGPVGIVDKIDLDRLTAEMRGPATANIFGAVRMLNPAAQQGLLDQKEFREAVAGASRSGDPVKMNAAYSLMDMLQKQNPLQFEKQFPDGLKDLRAWQSNLAFYPPDEAAKRMLQSNDPAQSAAREASDKAADKALENFSASKVVSKFSTGFLMFGTTAQAPVSEQAGIAAGALKADYDKNFRDGFAGTGDANAADNFAMEKLNLKYGMSPSNGNRVMAYPPERYYPQVGGSHDWMARQLDDELARHLGVATMPPLEAGFAAAVEPTALYATAETPAERQYGAGRALVADDTTQSDIAAGRPPSYQVVLQDPNGRWNVLSTNGLVQRFRFDPTALFAQRAAAAEQARPTVQALTQQTPFAVTP